MKALAMAIGLLGSGLVSAADEYRIDPLHSSILVRVDHLGFSRSVARVGRWQGELFIDPDDPSRNRVSVRIDASSIDFGDADWNRTMQGRRWLNVDEFPDIRFASAPGGWRVREIRAEKDPTFSHELHGELSLLGATLPVVLDVVENRSGTHPLTLRHTVGYSASARFQRSAVGMDASLGQVGDVVEVLIEIEASKVVERPSGRKR